MNMRPATDRELAKFMVKTLGHYAKGNVLHYQRRLRDPVYRRRVIRVYRLRA